MSLPNLRIFRFVFFRKVIQKHLGNPGGTSQHTSQRRPYAPSLYTALDPQRLVQYVKLLFPPVSIALHRPEKRFYLLIRLQLPSDRVRPVNRFRLCLTPNQDVPLVGTHRVKQNAMRPKTIDGQNRLPYTTRSQKLNKPQRTLISGENIVVK